ncbi:hypothetical protein [Chitinibacter sp. ZOR0017]|uniref:hypothetical protein n=1 Tax=Chitinibacter sp. ZOR0017 TaxID=1339254 RepID=UPI00068D2F11|nr:hypothetical protein [Chitinibacter sp. ZOR0017]
MSINTFALGFVLYQPKDSFFDRLQKISELGVSIYIFDNSTSLIEGGHAIGAGGNIFYEKNAKNYGLGKGLYDLANRAYSDGKKALIFFDQDTVITPETILFIMKCCEDPTVDFYNACAILFSGRRKELIGFEPAISNVKLAINSGTLFNLECLKEIGWHDPSFFVDGVDYEFCLRCKIRKKIIIEVSNAPGFDHVSEQDDLTYKIFGLKLRMRAYPFFRIKDYIFSSSRLLFKSIASGEFSFARELARQLSIYMLSQAIVRLLNVFGCGSNGK